MYNSYLNDLNLMLILYNSGSQTRGVGNIQRGGEAVVDLGGYLGNKKICHMALSNYTKRTLFHFVFFKNFLAGGGHPLLHHPRSKLHNPSYIRMGRLFLLKYLTYLPIKDCLDEPRVF